MHTHNRIELLRNELMQIGVHADDTEQRIIERLGQQQRSNRNANLRLADNLTFGERLADRVAMFGGSWTFILIFLVLLFSWIGLITIVLLKWAKPFDPYPYIFLNLILSMLAALQAPVIMMSQNRHAAKDRVAAGNDYEVNSKAEQEILSLHQKIDNLREQQWAELVAMQQQQIKLLTTLLETKVLSH